VTRMPATEGFTDQDLRGYLLGALDADSEERLEDRLLAEERTDDDSIEEALLAVEDELVDDYVRGDLDSDERERFRRQFLCNEGRRRKLEFAAAFRDHVDSHAVPDSYTVKRKSDWDLPRLIDRFRGWSAAPVQVYALAAMLMVSLAGVTWVLSDRSRLEGRLDQVIADRNGLQEQVVELGQQVDSMSVEPVVLRPSTRSRDVTLRGDDSVGEVVLPAAPGLIHFLLDIGLDDYESYRAVLHEYGDGDFWSQSNLRGAKTDDTVVVRVTLPSEILRRGEYHFRLSGVSSNG